MAEYEAINEAFRYVEERPCLLERMLAEEREQKRKQSDQDDACGKQYGNTYYL